MRKSYRRFWHDKRQNGEKAGSTTHVLEKNNSLTNHDKSFIKYIYFCSIFIKMTTIANSFIKVLLYLLYDKMDLYRK